MSTQPIVNSILTTKTTAEVDEQVERELQVPDPQRDKAMASLIPSEDQDDKDDADGES